MKIKVKINRLVESDKTNVLAYASATLADMFTVHGLRVVATKNGNAVFMPQREYADKDGVVKYADVFHPTTRDARSELTVAVLKAYEEQRAAAHGFSRSGRTSASAPEQPDPPDMYDAALYY